ncbi:hypothetical protein SBV1_770003 [Verrucomicrobia bacterium]|nr:hypothetical protein SBV1_770003 [Verrucomicrobiota bacterium]
MPSRINPGKGEAFNLIELPNQEKMVRLTRRTELENILFFLGIILLSFNLVLFIQVGTGVSRHGRSLSPQFTLIPYAVAAVGLAAVLLATRICFRNYLPGRSGSALRLSRLQNPLVGSCSPPFSAAGHFWHSN